MTTPRLGAEEVAELERLHFRDTASGGWSPRYYCKTCTDVEWPCVFGKLLAERREREAKLAYLESYKETKNHNERVMRADIEREERRTKEAEAKLARVRTVMALFERDVSKQMLDEALADPPRTAKEETDHA